ncbi:MAG: 50S ribosomal protein L25 [Thermoanaerobaculia bacterium]|nr:MAG: 50S ribosomal protein L25 [Thermoanaerobaculia bacterium]
MAEITIEVVRRERVGKSDSRRLRRADLIPAVLYGAGREPVSIQVPRRVLTDSFKEGGHENRIFLLKLGGTDQTRHAMIRELQLDPIDHRIVHVDFQRILMDQKVRVKVHLELEGVPHGVKTDGGILDFVTREIEVECMPSAIPHEVKVEVSSLRVGDHLEMGAVQLPDGVTYLGSPEVVVASVKHARMEVVETPAAEGAPVAAAATAPAEPEVIQRGKKEEAKES